MDINFQADLSKDDYGVADACENANEPCENCGSPTYITHTERDDAGKRLITTYCPNCSETFG